MAFRPPTPFNIADYFLDDRLREGLGERIAIRTDEGNLTYSDVAARANKFANLLTEIGVEPEQRVMVALPDIPDFAAALFGTLKVGGAVVMVNCHLGEEQIADFFEYTRAKVAVVHVDHIEMFRRASEGSPFLKEILVVGDEVTEARLDDAPAEFENFASHPDDPAIWLFSGGTTGRPKGVIQSHASFVNTTELYAHGVIGYGPDDVILSVPKLYFGYATGSNLLFPFSVGGSCILFPQRCTADALFEQIARHRPTILINVPTMVNHMVSHEASADQDLSCLRLATSAGEALPVELHQRWNEAFGVQLLDGLGTAEMWHVFISNQPGHVKPGTLGKVVPGFDVRLCDAEGNEVPADAVGQMRVRGDSRAIQYWQHPEKTREAFHGEWYVSGDMMSRDTEGYFTYRGRSDDLLKVSGKWLSPQEVENCLLEHEAVKEVAVVGIETGDGLVKPDAFVVLVDDLDATGMEAVLQTHVKEGLEPYKYPRTVHFLDDLPRTHLGKVDRGRLRRGEQ